jgi:outer membrane protein OmpA-like peptidoglycan-associated protein
MRLQSLFFILFGLTLPFQLFPQTLDHPWNMGIHFGKSEFNGDIGDASFNWSKPFYGFAGVSFARYGNQSIDVLFNFNRGELGYWADGDSIHYSNGKFHGHMYGAHTDGTVYLKYKFSNGYIFKENSRVQFSLLLGIGLSWLTGENVYDYYVNQLMQLNNFTAKDFTVSSGWNIGVRLSKRFTVYEQSVFVYTDHDGRDGYIINNNDGYLMHNLGITYNFGKAVRGSSMPAEERMPKSRKAECRCELFDRDSDGILDRFDLCPDTPGTLQARGCPDRDWDGIPDKLDKCPDVYGLARFDGCPDTDGDGIPDNQDSCMTVPGLKQNNGCPDTDGDGIPDYKDECPTAKGLSIFHGCPDTDGDSVPDNKDRCPREAGPKWNYGCPEIKESVRKIFEQALTGIQFQTAKSIILPKSFPILDNVVKVCKENPTYYIIINGHTDNQGDDLKNMKLSDDRANAVRLYLIKKGVPATRLESHGYGPTQPIDTNDTPEGRARNRRVEFKVKLL